MSSTELPTRDQILSGSPARRARTLLFLIESRVAHLVARSQHAFDHFSTDETERQRDLAFFEAFALGREPPLRPTIQDIERYTAQWASLAPENSRLRAALAHFLGAKYAFTAQAVPGIRFALGLDTPDVQHAYQNLFGKSLDTIYAPRITPTLRLRWMFAALANRLEALPPFWIVFALNLTETVGGGILAVPIAFARVGPLPSVGLLIVLGIANILTIAAIAETVTRTGSVRYGNAFFGRMVAEYLGRAGAVLVTLALVVVFTAVLIAYYVGFAATLQSITPIPKVIWVAVLFLIGVYLVSRETLNSTIASALLIGFTNIALIVLLLLLVLPHARLDYIAFANIPFLGGRAFDPSILELVFGVVLAAYFGHTSVGSCGRIVLRRDPSGRSLFWGAVSAEITAVILYGLWVFAVNSSIAPEVLAAQKGTSLAPLADIVGPSVQIFGGMFVVLAMGMGSIILTLVLSSIVRERLPAVSHPIFLLPCRRGRLEFFERGNPEASPRIGLTYLGPARDQRKFQLEIHSPTGVRRLEVMMAERWDARSLHEQYSDLAPAGIDLRIEISDASAEHVRLRVMSSLAVNYVEAWDHIGVHLLDALAEPNSDWQLTQWMLRRGSVSACDVATYLGQDEASAIATLDALVEIGHVVETRQGATTRYRARLARRRARALSEKIWNALDGKPEPDTNHPSRALPNALAQRLKGAFSSQRGRMLISFSPVIAIFLFTEWLVFTGAESFTAALNFGGVVAIPIFAGIFPVLLLIASRRRGDIVPKFVCRFLGHPLLLAILYGVFFASLLAHGLVIWQEPLPRGMALVASLIVIALTIGVIRRGLFKPRIVVEIRQDPDDQCGHFEISARGQPLAANVRLDCDGNAQTYRAASGQTPPLGKLRSAIFDLPQTDWQELLVWAHKITSEGRSEGLPVRVRTQCGDAANECDLALPGGRMSQPIARAACRVEIKFAKQN